MASIHFVCPVCAQNLKVSATLAGRKGRCPFCAAKVRIPVEDNGSAEIIDGSKKSAGSDLAPAPVMDGNLTSGVMGPSVLMQPANAPSAPSGMPTPEAPPPVTTKLLPAGDLQSQLDRELGDANVEHPHDAQAATVKWKAGQAPASGALQPGQAGGAEPVAPILKVTRLEPNAAGAPDEVPPLEPPAAVLSPPVEFTDESAARVATVEAPGGAARGEAPTAPMPMPEAATPDQPDLPPVGATPVKGETLKYDPAQNPARQSGSLPPQALQADSVADRFESRRERPVTPNPGLPRRLTPAGLPEVAKATVPAPDSLALPRVAVEHAIADAAANPRPPAALPTSAGVGDFFAEQSENPVGDVLASLPRERSRPTSAMGALAARSMSPNPPQVAVAPVAAMQSPVMPLHGGGAAASLIGDRCDPSRHGQSAVPVIVAVALVLLTLGGLTAWLVIDGLNRRAASIQASQAFLRVTDLAAAEAEYFSAPRTTVNGPSALADAPTTAVTALPGSLYASNFAALQDRKLLNTALWQSGVQVVDGPVAQPAAATAATGAATVGQAAPAAGTLLANANGYRYELWTGHAGNAAGNYYSRTPAELDRGFAIAAIPTDGANWAYAIDARGRLIEWRYLPPAASAAGGEVAAAGDPVRAHLYPADSDPDKIPIR